LYLNLSAIFRAGSSHTLSFWEQGRVQPLPIDRIRNRRQPVRNHPQPPAKDFSENRLTAFVAANECQEIQKPRYCFCIALHGKVARDETDTQRVVHTPGLSPFYCGDTPLSFT
jgi:hypothetical protein